MNSFLHAALVADAFSLGAHWVYDQEEIAEAFPVGIKEFADPLSEYHEGKRAGDFTHYGDQTLFLNDSIEKNDGFDRAKWREDWLSEMENYQGYVDGASKETLLTKGAMPSGSSDLGGAARIAPILDLDLPMEEAVLAAREQTILTHGNPVVSDVAEFFVRASYAVREGAIFEDALQSAAEEGDFTKLDAKKHLETAQELRDEPFTTVAEELGQACGVEDAFPLSLYFLLRPETEFEKTISDNAMAGGDSSARAMLMALLFAAEDTEVATEWVDGLRAL